MRKWLFVVVMAGALWLPQTAHAHSQIVVGEGFPGAPYQQWVDTSLVQTPKGHIRIDEAPCPVLPDRGCTEHRLIYLPPFAVREDYLFHELGHVFDLYYLWPVDRTRAKHILGFPPGTVWFASPESGLPTPAEQFADAYAYCAMFSAPDPSTQYISQPVLSAHNLDTDGLQTEKLCSLIRHAHRWR